MNSIARGLALLVLVIVSAGSAWSATSSEGTAQKGESMAHPSSSGCCDGPGDGEYEVNILNIEGLTEGELLGSQLQNQFSIVFPPTTIAPAPDGPDARVWVDDARPECDGLHAWAISGEPHFPLEGDGDEVLQFLGPGDVPMVVNRVTISVGYHNGINTTMSAYDVDGELLEEISNGVVEGFEEMTIDRSWTDPDIHYVVVSAPLDPNGVGLNCIRYPIPVSMEPPTPTAPTSWGDIKALF